MTIKIKAKLVSSRVNTELFTKTLKKRLSVLHRESVRVWLRVVLKETPVYTGTARGTFQPVGRLVGRVVGRQGPVSSRAASKKNFVWPRGGRRWPLGFDQGRDHADADLTEVDTGISIEYTFTFIRDLPYALWNDIQPAPARFQLIKPTPWRALDKAADAWDVFVTENIFKKLPSFTSGLEISIVRVG